MSDRPVLEKGATLPTLEIPPLSRTTLALYCGASNDHHPLHVDVDWVRENTDLPDVIGHGMLTMAYLGRLLTAHFDIAEIKSLQTRFRAPSQVGDKVLCSGVVETVSNGDRGRTAEIAVEAKTPDGRVLATGSAVVEVAR